MSERPSTGVLTAPERFSPDPHYPIQVSELPVGWALVRLGDVVADIKAGFASGDYNIEGRGIPHLRPMNVSREGNLILTETKFVAPDVSPLRTAVGDVLFNNTNSAELVGKTAPVDLAGELGFSNHMTRLRMPKGVSYRFVARQLHYLWETGYFRMRSTQHVNQASISATTLSQSVPLLLAPPEEQLRIAAAIDDYYDRLATVSSLLADVRAQVEHYRQATLASAVQGTLVSTEASLAAQEGREYESASVLHERLIARSEQRHPGQIASRTAPRSLTARHATQHQPRDLPALPEGWTWATVGQVGDLLLGRQRSPEHHQGPYLRPYLRVANVHEDWIDSADVHQMNFTPAEYRVFALRRGDILLNEGQSPDLVGRPAMYRDEVPGCCFQNTLIRFRAHPGVSASFALLVFRHYLHNGRFKDAARWTTNIAHLGLSRFGAIEFPLPPLAEQERIVVEAERRLSIIGDIEATVRSATEQVTIVRRAVLESAFAGTLASSHASDTPVAALLSSAVREGFRDSSGTEARQAGDTKPQRLPRQPKGARAKVTHATGPSDRGTMSRTPLVRLLAQSSSPLSPEELFRRSGIPEDLIDEFFSELKREEAAGRLRQFVDDRGKVRLVNSALERGEGE